jgi:glycerate kinase
MNILIAIDSFKGSLSSRELSDTIEEGLNEVSPDFNIQKVPIADGGEGTMEALIGAIGGEKVNLNVSGPLFEEIAAEYGILPDKTVVLDIASAAGLILVAEEKMNPLRTTTLGVGQMILDAINKGHRNFIIGIGGSATNDGGIGMLTELGYRFLDEDGHILKPVGASLSKIDKIDTGNAFSALEECNFMVACDVNNPLFGPNGAAHVYARQKGASEADVTILDKGLRNYSQVISKEMNIDIADIPGSGAAGGLGGGFKAFLNSQLKPGIEILFEQVRLEEKIKWADIVITGEGRIDHQTIMGKVVSGVAQLGKMHNKKVIALAGSIADNTDELYALGVDSMYSIMDASISLEEAMIPENAKGMVKKKVVEIFK